MLVIFTKINKSETEEPKEKNMYSLWNHKYIVKEGLFTREIVLRKGYLRTETTNS